MEIIKAIILGLVQGLSEFLPISSSGHLVLAAEFLNFQEEGIAFEVFVHFGTLLSELECGGFPTIGCTSCVSFQRRDECHCLRKS